MKKIIVKFILIAGVSICLINLPKFVLAQEEIEEITNEDCMMCHEDFEEDLYVDFDKFDDSVHGGFDCTSCHADIKEVPHDSPLKPVVCGECHEKEQKYFDDSLHGVALARGDKLAPRCASCHGNHDILPLDDRDSNVAPLKIPFLCGSCHSEGTNVMRQRTIHQDHILENYSESIHAEGLFKKGLSVSATCVSCHNAHQILPHTDPRSSISKINVVETCLKCHSEIENVHRKVIEGELWEKRPQSIPVCVECHQPHKARKVFYDEGVSDRDCMLCHGKDDITASVDGRSLFVDSKEVETSVHAAVTCAQCHTEINPSRDRACETITNKVDCSICHSEQVNDYRQSTHGSLFAEGNKNAPSCRDCHGIHGILGKKNIESMTFPTNVPNLCGQCHRTNEKAALQYKGTETEITEHYIESIHGKGLLKSGLVVTAMCTNCHTAHKELPESNPESSVNSKNIAKTCGQCHKGVYEQYIGSVHAPLEKDPNKDYPVCNDCHTAHTIKRIDMDQFKFSVMNVCGKCHEDIAETYFDTYHGKASKLGYAKTAKCHDCHGSHKMLPPTDPHSTLSRQNIVQTCQQCHPGAGRKFAGYLTHATHHNPQKYPWIFWTFWAMTGLLVFTFTMSGLHTLMWLPRSFQMRGKCPVKKEGESKKQYVRFPLLYRILHAIMIVSFLTLAVTGMTLKFSYMPWAMRLSKLMGGLEVSGFIHRSAALLMFGLFGVHLFDLARRKKTEFGTWKELLFGENTMLPTWRDVKEFIATIKWYAHKGPRPQYGRWTYWEKFDYLAVFWGITIIGASGLMLWFPEFFTLFLPGWVINVATIIHSDEALLATGFIFTIHFFNTHFRPEKFPMDKVIFTGRTSLEELKHERPLEYESLVKAGKLENRLADPLDQKIVKIITIFATLALLIGMTLIVGIIYTMIFAYK